MNIKKGKHYTFSAYVKNNNQVKLCLSYIDKNGTMVETESEIIDSSDTFERNDVTIFYPEDATSNLSVKIYLCTTGTAYVDDVQLEEGQVVNNYNLLENSDFSDGFSDWDLSVWGQDGEKNANDYFSIVNITNDIKALKIKTNPVYGVNMEKTFKINGKGGDIFNISYWYKNEGIDSKLSMYYGSRVNIGFHYINEDNGHCGIINPIMNPNNESWQYVSNDFMAEEDYDAITLSFYREYDANDLYITNLNLFKDIRNVYYEYDENGNIIIKNGLDNSSTEFNYDKNNQLIQMINPNGKGFIFEYDNNVTDRVINGISEMGVSNQIKYDENGNPIATRIIKNNVTGDLTDGLYKIRLKGSNKYLRFINNELKIKPEDCNHDLWLLEKVEENFKIHHSIVTDKYFTVQNDLLILSNEDGDNSLFTLTKKENGSYLFKLKSEDKYLKTNNESLEISSLNDDDYHFEFYIEIDNSNLFIENTATYTKDGKFIKSTTDTLLNKTLYDIDELTGKVKSVTNASGQVMYYGYDSKNRLISISEGNKKIIYEYNEQNELEKIIEGDRKYTFEYDEFLNIISIKLNDQIIFKNNNYEINNGNLSSVVYGNENKISYEYDEFDRVSKLIKMNEVYNYKYNSNGDLEKIISEEGIIKYTYDLGRKLARYQYNDFKIDYRYDANENIINIRNILNNSTNNVTNSFNNDDSIVKTVFDQNEIDYKYDDIGRIVSRIINNSYNTEYKYLTNGRKTSLVVENLKNGDEEYSYRYDKSNNITKIFKNGVLVKKYFYDEYNELIKEIDYILNQIFKYKYDRYGNILYRNIYSLDNLKLIKSNKYEYNNSWSDQLSSFNGENILYDEIGNPTKIGNHINLKWINGRELSSYMDSDNLINYKYNKDGIRISKTINNLETKYYLDGIQIVYEKTGDNVIYYMYNDVDDLIGFKYNNEVFYYKKNAQNDIIGIIDSNYNIVAKYYYDSLGNVISILDKDNNDISNNYNNVANINPFRYRSYYYDKETELYYLNNRYYNPKWGRFINSDTIINQNEDILGYNLYAYCSNNFINYSDYTGEGLISNIIKAVKKLFSSSKSTKKASTKKSTTKKATVVKSSSSKAKAPTNGHGNLPTTGQPNSTARKPNGDLRSYGPDGKASTDTDYSHPERHPDLPNPHAHDWTWNGDTPSRGPAYDPSVNKIIAGTAVTVGAGYLIYRGIRMIPSLLPPFWWSIPLNAVTP